MLDKTVPHYGVIMKRDDSFVSPKFHLPEGYSFEYYKIGDEDDWAEIEFNVGEFDSKEAALKRFQDEFGQQKAALKERCLFIVNQQKVKVATAMAWYGVLDGIPMSRIHWVAVIPTEQNKGLCKALISETMNIFNHFNNQMVYLTTQTWSYKAINIYRKFGFVPYEEKISHTEVSLSSDFKVNFEQAWQLIEEKINQHKR